jgi:hypothetical protein
MLPIQNPEEKLPQRGLPMEKRAARRHPINTSILCRHLNAAMAGSTFDGIMKNFSIGGIYAELTAGFDLGTFLVIRVTGDSRGYSKDEGFQSVTVAEVKWSKLIPAEEETRYATGLKYVII